jgi:hypothetical protein
MEIVMSAAGTWRVIIPITGKEFTLVLTPAEAGKLNGTMGEKNGGRPDPIANGWERADDVHWEVPTSYDSKFDAKYSGNTMKGTVRTTLGDAPFTGTRV